MKELWTCFVIAFVFLTGYALGARHVPKLEIEPYAANLLLDGPPVAMPLTYEPKYQIGQATQWINKTYDELRKEGKFPRTYAEIWSTCVEDTNLTVQYELESDHTKDRIVIYDPKKDKAGS